MQRNTQKMSYSSYKSGPPRGRGFMARGSNRGSSSGGGWRGNSRGGYSPPRSSRGRGGWHREPPSSSSYEHGRSSRYAGTDGINEERFSSRNRDEGSFRRYSRQDSPGYMEGSHHRSPESSRKRMRSNDHGFNQSHHRSHESSSYDMNQRYSSSSGGASYDDKGYDRYRDERRSYRDHHSGGGDRYPPSRDDYLHHRKDKDIDRHESMGRSSMPPPPPPSMPRHSASPRRSSFRGRGGIDRGRSSRGRSLRGSSRGSRASLSLRKVDSIASLKRKTMAEASYSIKKKVLASSRSQDQMKKIRMQKIRRIKENLETPDENEEPAGKDKEQENKEDKSPQEECGAEPVKPKDENEEEPEKPKKEKEEDDDDDDDDKSETKDEKKENSDSNSVQVTIKQNTEGRAVNDDGNHKSPIGRRFIRLQCPHCHERCITFKQYSTHLYSNRHMASMSRLHLRHKQLIVRMRQQQRKQQREDEEHDTDSLTKISSFCPVCKLNYRQSRLKHTNSKMHQEMKKFLFPYCKVCGIPFKATLLYDKHICSLEHIRREAYMEERLRQLEGRVRKREHDDDGDVDMDGFMIVDSVGDVDDAEDAEGDKLEEKDAESIVGVEFVKKVDAQYCELCQRYLPRLDDLERAQAVHCRSSQHLRLYREQQRKIKVEVLEQDKEKPASEPEQNGKEPEENADDAERGVGSPSEVGLEVGDTADPEEADDQTHEEEAAEEKLWASVDKDLGELLRDVEPEEEERGKSSDDDESVVESGRYDRFRNSEKNKQKLANKAESNDTEPISGTPIKE